MAKKSVALDGLLNPTAKRPVDTGVPQRGTEPSAAKKSSKRVGEKRLTLALDGETYRRLRIHAAETDQTHQAILELSLAEYLKRTSA